MEKWKDISNYEGLYQVSDWGRVRSIDRVIISKRRTSQTLKGRIIKISINNHHGYCQVGLSKHDITKSKRVHKLVALAFLPNPLNLPHINHKNGIKTDNRADNLEWCDALYNMRHAKETGLLRKKGEGRLRYTAKKLTESEKIEREKKWQHYMEELKKIAPEMRYGHQIDICKSLGKSRKYLEIMLNGQIQDPDKLEIAYNAIVSHIEAQNNLNNPIRPRPSRMGEKHNYKRKKK